MKLYNYFKNILVINFLLFSKNLQAEKSLIFKTDIKAPSKGECRNNVS